MLFFIYFSIFLWMDEADIYDDPNYDDVMRMTMRRRRRRTLREGSLEEKAAVTNVRTGGAHCLTLITGVPSSSFPSFETEVWSQI